jgi:hypothetical protein
MNQYGKKYLISNDNTNEQAEWWATNGQSGLLPSDDGEKAAQIVLVDPQPGQNDSSEEDSQIITLKLETPRVIKEKFFNIGPNPKLSDRALDDYGTRILYADKKVKSPHFFKKVYESHPVVNFSGFNTLLDTEDRLLENIPDNAWVVGVRYNINLKDIQIGITGTPKEVTGKRSAFQQQGEDPEDALRRELLEEIGLKWNGDLIAQNLSYKRGKYFNVSLINAANLNIPDRPTKKDRRRDFSRGHPEFYKVLSVVYTTDPPDFIRKIKQSAKNGGTNQWQDDDIDSIVLLPIKLLKKIYPVFDYDRHERKGGRRKTRKKHAKKSKKRHTRKKVRGIKKTRKNRNKRKRNKKTRKRR